MRYCCTAAQGYLLLFEDILGAKYATPFSTKSQTRQVLERQSTIREIFAGPKPLNPHAIGS